MRHLGRQLTAFTLPLIVVSFIACSSGGGKEVGASGTGEISGGTSTGGAPSSGGAAGIGGRAVPAGGTGATGGELAVGGTVATGGAMDTGGAGGTPGAGGAMAVGGSLGSGGTGPTGGVAALGGTAPSGGAAATGGSVGGGEWGDPAGFPASRNVYRWPFDRYSIWNTPIGSEAVYAEARIQAAAEGFTSDEDLIVMRPDAPLVSIFYSDAGWDRTKDRCVRTDDTVLAEVRIPGDYVYRADPGETPNAGLAVLEADGRTIFQTQPFSRCVAGESATSMRTEEDWSVDIYGDGIRGCHGASQLSCIGGTLRIGELRPGQHPPRHVLKVNFFAKYNLAQCNDWTEWEPFETACWRWPAKTADGYAPLRYMPTDCLDNYYCNAYGATHRTDIPANMKMGVLLALHRDLDLTTLDLQTEPARMVAWTLQNYGAYLVDDTSWDVNALIVEQGTDGDFLQQFEADWGFPFNDYGDSAWYEDMQKLFTSLYMIDNNTPTSIGGGGTPRQPLAPDFAP